MMCDLRESYFQEVVILLHHEIFLWAARDHFFLCFHSQGSSSSLDVFNAIAHILFLGAERASEKVTKRGGMYA